MRRMDPARDDGERAWLVFRLGPHLMCASALDVEGIIEPVRARPVPGMPAYVLGWFDFRGQVATAISLRRKFGVRSGEDGASGPYMVTRVQGELVAFWVDEVRDVLEPQQASWQPMPDMLGASVFDRYTIRDGDVILHTTFAGLLQADSVAAFPPVAESAGPPAVPPVVEKPPGEEQPAAAPSPPVVEETAGEQPPAPAAPPPPQEPAAAAPYFTEAAQESPRPSTKPVAPAAAPAKPLERRAQDRAAEAAPVVRASPAPAPRPPEPVTQAQPEDWRPWEAEEIARARTDARQARWGLRAALALLAVLALGTLAWWLGEPGAPPEPPQAATAIGTIAAPAAAPAPQPEAQSTRVVTVKTDTFTLTVDRPAAPQPAPVVAANPPQPEGRLRHRVVRGDTLWEIAEHYLGNAARYPELARVSGIRDPNLIYPGDIVTIDTVTPGAAGPAPSTRR